MHTQIVNAYFVVCLNLTGSGRRVWEANWIMCRRDLTMFIHLLSDYAYCISYQVVIAFDFSVFFRANVLSNHNPAYLPTSTALSKLPSLLRVNVTSPSPSNAKYTELSNLRQLPVHEIRVKIEIN